MNRKDVSIRQSDTTHHPSKRFGQNFLTDRQVINRIIAAVAPTKEQTIVEIGPGKGALTGRLIENAGRVIAIEFDRQLIPLLTQTYGARENFTLIQSDALQTDICKAIKPATHARVVANLPYNISTAILHRLIAQRHCLTDMTLMLQREVVNRMIAAPGSSDRGYLSVFVEAYCETERLFDVAPGSFNPTPKVWSTVVRQTFRERIGAQITDENLLWQVVSAGFAQRRKTILNNLRSAPPTLEDKLKRSGGASIVLCRAEVDLQRRAETLTLEEWAHITRALE